MNPGPFYVQKPLFNNRVEESDLRGSADRWLAPP